MADEIRNIDLNFETNAEQVQGQVDNLNKSVDKTADATDKQAASTAKSTNSLKSNSIAVLENGGAMGLLNDLTGGYAMMVKDAVEASALFTRAKKIDTAITEVQTVATVSANTANQSAIITRIKDTATTAASTVAKGISTAATYVATAAQWLWNAAVVANPLVALVVALVAAGAAIYTFTKYLIDSSKANEDAAKNTAKNITALKQQSAAAAQSSDKLERYNNQQYALAEAAGASSKELRKLSLKHADELVALNKSNATIASNTFIRERNTLAVLKASGASDEVIKSQEKLTQSSYKELQEQNKILTDSYVARRDIINKNEVGRVQETTDAAQKALEKIKAREKKESDELEAKQKAEYDKQKVIADKKLADDMASATEALKIVDDLKKSQETPAQKEEREYLEKKAVLEKNNLDTEELTKQHLIKIADIFEEDRLAKNEKDEEDRLKKEENRIAVIEGEKELADARISIGQSVLDAAIGFADAETSVGRGLLVAKQLLNAASLAVQIQHDIKEGTLRIGRMTAKAGEAAVDIATGAAKSASAAPFPANLVLIAGYAITAASIIVGIKQALTKAKAGSAISGLSGGGGGGGGGGGSTPAGATPNVSFVASSENQIANSISKVQPEQAPIKAYVVSTEMSTQQQLDRNLVQATSL